MCIVRVCECVWACICVSSYGYVFINMSKYTSVNVCLRMSLCEYVNVCEFVCEHLGVFKCMMVQEYVYAIVCECMCISV